MARTRHDRATDDVLARHVGELERADELLRLASEEVARARSVRDAAIREAVEAGLSLRQIGTALGMSAQGVRSTLPTAQPVYDRIGTTYTTTRRADPRIQQAILAALDGARSVVNVGAGTGSYEPPQTILAVEPSMVMIAQRPQELAPAAVTTAERIPLPDDSVDAALCVLTIHHWPDLAAALAEIRRVARRVVIFTWDFAVTRDYWLCAEYLPEINAIDAQWAVGIDALCTALGGTTVTPVPVPHDCTDGFLGAYWRRPEAYLDPVVRAGISAFSKIDEAALERGLSALLADIQSGAWAARHADLLEQEALDVGYRLVVA